MLSSSTLCLLATSEEGTASYASGFIFTQPPARDWHSPRNVSTVIRIDATRSEGAPGKNSLPPSQEAETSKVETVRYCSANRSSSGVSSQLTSGKPSRSLCREGFLGCDANRRRIQREFCQGTSSASPLIRLSYHSFRDHWAITISTSM